MSDTKMTAEESCRQVLKSIADACDQESLARAGGYLFRYVQEETVLRDCGQRGVCRTPPGCARHWEERNRELVRETALRWTRERPTVPGWYWALITTRAEIVRVDRERDDAPLYVRTMFDDERLALTDVLCWQGPIPEPIGGDDE